MELPARTRNKSGFRGVHYDSQRGKWCAFIVIDKKRKNLGRYNTPEEAAAAYERACPPDRKEWIWSFPAWSEVHVDPEDEDLLRLNKHFCTRREGGFEAWITHPGQKSQALHQVIAERTYGPRPPGFVVDHKDGQPLNNRRANLRYVTLAQNGWNSKRRKNNSSGYKGVHWNQAQQKWVVQVTIHGRTHTLGSYTDRHEAGQVAAEFRRKHQGEFCHRSDVEICQWSNR